MKKRGTINLIIDVLLLLVMAGLAGIGLLIKYRLPSGRDKILRTGSNQDLSLWGLDRHGWGDIHLLLAYAIIALLVLHILFHWGAVVAMVRQRLPRTVVRRFAWTAMGLLTLLLLFFSFLFDPMPLPQGSFLHRNTHDHRAEEGLALPGSQPDLQTHDHTEEEINGRMSLADAAQHMGLSVAEIRLRLGLSDDVDERETLGHIRKTLGVNMEQLRERMQKKEE